MQNYNSIFTKALFLFFGILLVLGSLIPTSLASKTQISPDFLFCFIFIFLVRRPESVTLIPIVFISLLADFLWYRPIGLNTLMFVLGSESLRWVIHSRARISLLEEFIYVSLILVSSKLFIELIKFLTSIPSLALSDIINYILFSLLTYFMITIVIKVIIK